MFISKMNKAFHKHGKWAFAILTVLIIIPFVLYFSASPEEILGSLGRGIGNSKFSMYGKRISQREMDRSVKGAEIYLLMQGLSPDYINSAEGNKQVEMFALERLRLLRKADSLGIGVSDVEVASFLKKVQFLSNDGVFDYSRYQMFAYSLRRYGYDENDLISSIKDTIKIDDLMNLVTASVINTPAGLRGFYDSMNLSYKVRSKTFLSESYLDKVKVDDKSLSAYFDHNKDKYVIPSESKASLVEFPFSKYMEEAQRTVTTKDIDNYYQAHSDEYKKEKETGVSIHFVTEELDAGDIIIQKRFPIEKGDNFNRIVKKNYQLAPIAMLEALDKLERGERSFIENNDDLATYNTVPTFKEALRYRIGRFLGR